MKTKERLKKLRDECADWGGVIGFFTMHGLSANAAERAILELLDVGLIRIEPQPNGPTAFVLTIPPELEGVLPHVEE